MRLFLPIFLLLCLSALAASAQNASLKGRISDVVSGASLPDVRVYLNERISISDAYGIYTFEDLPAGEYELVATLDAYQVFRRSVLLNEGEALTLDVALKGIEGRESLSAEDLIPTVTLSTAEEESLGAQGISGILTASRDVFVSAAAFTFGPARFRIRGYDSENTSLFLNGVPMNELENGRPIWGMWGGLNDVMRNAEISTDLQAVDYGIGGIGGANFIDLRASRQRKQIRASYALSNRSYRNRLMLTYNTGLLDNGWAFSFSASRRWADEGYIPATFYDAWSYFVSIDKQFNDKHLLNFVLLGAPNKRGRSGAAVQELYDLAGSNFYNPYWGFQNGEVRNSRVAETHQPIAMLRHDWQISQRQNLMTTLSYQAGRNGSTALDWYGAADPRPEYYRRLPSYIQDEAQAAAVAQALREDEALRQLNFDQMYNVNYNSFETVEDADGIAGNTVSGLRSKYIIEDRRYDSEELNVNAVYKHLLSDHAILSGGASYQMYTGHNFKVVDDLMGGEFYLDIDRFAERDFPDNPEALQNDLNNPNRIVREGDRWGYDYDSNIRRAAAWAQGNFSFDRVDFFVAAELSNTQFWRTGNVRNGRFPDSSFGDSEVQRFTNYMVKGGATYKINGRNYLYANAATLTRAPFFRNAYVSPRTRDELAPDLQNESIRSAEAGYTLRAPYFKARVSGYFTQFDNATESTSFYDDEQQSFVNYTLTNIDRIHQGMEVAFDARIVSGLNLTGVAAIGQYFYNDRMLATITQDNDATVLVRNRTIYSDNFYVPGTPQTAYTMGLNYNSKNFWFLNVNFNYFDNVWMDFNPNRRTLVAVEGVEFGSQQYYDIINQEKAPAAFTMDIFGGKSWKIRDYFVYLNVGVNNVLNNTEFITGGYEQLRFDFEGKDVNVFPNRYFYNLGLNYFINLSVRM